MEDTSPHVPLILNTACEKLQITDHAISDQQVVVAYQACASPPQYDPDRHEAMVTVAEARESSFLRFIMNIEGCLTNGIVVMLDHGSNGRLIDYELETPCK